MKLTNIRYNNNFVISDGEKFYLSEINKGIYDKYIKDKQSFELKEYSKKDITKKLTRLMKKYDTYSHVNFYGFDGQTGGG